MSQQFKRCFIGGMAYPYVAVPMTLPQNYQFLGTEKQWRNLPSASDALGSLVPVPVATGCFVRADLGADWAQNE